MSERSGDPHQIEAELEEAEEYQAPPRQHEQDVDDDRTPSSGAGDHVDLSLLQAQQRRQGPEMSEPKSKPATPPRTTISNKDELADPANPRATPPGERM